MGEGFEKAFVLGSLLQPDTEFKSDGNGAFQEFVTGIHQPTDFEILAAAVEAQ